MNAARRFTLTTLALPCALAVGLLLSLAPPVQARLLHPYLSQLTGFGNPVAVTVDAGSSDVYIVDGTTHTLDRFDAAGAPAPFSASESYVEGAKLTGTPSGGFGGVAGTAVDNTSGDVYVTDVQRHAVDVFSSTGEYLSQLRGTCPSPGTKCAEGEVIPFGEPDGLAVDQATHDLYVTDRASRVVDVFSSAGEYLSQFGSGMLTYYDESVAVDELTGDAYVGDSSPDLVYAFSPLGSFIPPEWTGASTPAGHFRGYVYVGLDQVAGRVYVADTAHKVVDEFNLASTEEYEGQVTGTPSGPFVRPQAIAVAPSGNLYIADQSGVVDMFGPNVVVPDVTTSPASNLKGGGVVTLNGTVNPQGVGAANCEFVWGTSESFGKVAPCSVEGIEGSSAVAVSATLTGLRRHTTYYYRLQATNGNGTNFGEASQDQHFTALGPGMEGESVSEVASTSATLEARINPNSAPTSYYFQYSTVSTAACEANPSACTSAPATPGEAIGSGAEAVQVAQQIRGLSPRTAYHYRVVAVSDLVTGETETAYGEDRTFITQIGGNGLVLPDGRAWELVSPANNLGAYFYSIAKKLFSPNQIKASAAGDAMTYLALSPTEAQPPGIVSGTQVLSRRGATGWSSQDIATPHETASGISGALGPEYEAFTEDLSVSLVQPYYFETALLSPLASEATSYLRRQSLCEAQATQSECYLPLVTGKEGYADVPPGTRFYPNPLQEGGGGGVQFEGADPSLEHVVLKSKTVPLTSAPGGKLRPYTLYEWSAQKPPTERLQLVSQLPASEGGQEVSAYLGGRQFFVSGAMGAITRDGSRVFWNEESRSSRHLYLRDLAKGETLRIDTPQPGVKVQEDGRGPDFQFTADEGSKVFFTDGEPLTTDAGAKPNKPDLYECEIVEEGGQLACGLRDLTPRNASGESAGLEYLVLGGTEDGSYVYFVANGVLAPGAAPGTCSSVGPSPGAMCNLYVLHDGATKFIATLSGLDESDWGEGGENRELMAARMSPNGRYLTFTSSRALTGYDNTDARSGQPDQEVYLYDAQASRLTCASCNPTGARPVGVVNNETAMVRENGLQVDGGSIWYAGELPQWTNESYQSRFLSNSGRLFFDSSDALVPQDINGKMDVYQYEPEGVGNCTSSSATFTAGADGCVGLISSGLSSNESAFMDASETGDDVFFLSSEKLVSQDSNTDLNVYDAHVCSSASPCPASLSAPPACTTADACRTAPSPQPSIFGAPSSATFSGAGNLSPGGGPVKGSPVKPKTLTRAQKLARALKACRARRAKRRAKCERRARARFAVKQSGKAKSTKRGMR